MACRYLHGIVVEGGDEAWEGESGAGALYLHTDLVLSFRARLAQQRDGGQSFVVDPGNQEDVGGPVLLPKLSNLDFSHAHGATSDCREPGQKCQQFPCSALPIGL